MELLGGSPDRPWDDDAAMAALRAEAVTGDGEEAYHSACRGWATDLARTAHDTARDEAVDIARVSVVELESNHPDVLYARSWPEVRVTLTALVEAEVSRRQGTESYGAGDEPTIRFHLRRGARKFRADQSWHDEAVDRALEKVIRSSWYRRGERRGPGFFVRGGYWAAVDIYRELQREKRAEERLLAGTAARPDELVARSAEDAALSRAALMSQLLASQRAAEEAGRAARECRETDLRRAEAVRVQARNLLLAEDPPYCLYHLGRCALDADLKRDTMDALASMVTLDGYWRLLEPYLERYRVPSPNRHEFWRTVRRCAEWRTYRVFGGTDADGASRHGNDAGDVEADPLRWQLIEKWTLQPRDGGWDSAVAPVRQVRLLVARDPLFTPLLAHQKPHVAALLRLTPPPGA